MTNKNISFGHYLNSEVKAGYKLENDEETFNERREKVYRFLKIPLELEKFFCFGFLQCTDSFAFVISFIPIRFILALWNLANRLCTAERHNGSLLKPDEKIDLLKGYLILVCCYLLSYMDASIVYHMIKTQSTIKLYIFYNMLDIADRLMAAFGQDILDSLFWTATEQRDRKREHFSLLPYIIISTIYVAIHAVIVMFQALTLSVAINSETKGLLTIMTSNNFIEIKGSVFKKYDTSNLLQVTCSDVRERFHQSILLFIVIMLTMNEYSWMEERLRSLLHMCVLIWFVEIFIDWIKHAFITRFNEIPHGTYKSYTLLIAAEVIRCKQKSSFSDHSDYVARRLGFIPLPLGVVIFRICYTSLKFNNYLSYLLLLLGFLCLLSFRILNGLVILGKSCSLIAADEAEQAAAKVTVPTKPTAVCDRPTPVKNVVCKQPRPIEKPPNEPIIETIRHCASQTSKVTSIPDFKYNDLLIENLTGYARRISGPATPRRRLESEHSAPDFDISESDLLPTLRKGILVMNKREMSPTRFLKHQNYIKSNIY